MIIKLTMKYYDSFISIDRIWKRSKIRTKHETCFYYNVNNFIYARVLFAKTQTIVWPQIFDPNINMKFFMLFLLFLGDFFISGRTRQFIRKSRRNNSQRNSSERSSRKGSESLAWTLFSRIFKESIYGYSPGHLWRYQK